MAARDKLKEFFDMTKRERRGTIALLLIMIVVLAATFFMRMGKDDTCLTDNAAAVEAFEAQADSAAVVMDKPKHRKTDKKKHSRKRRADKKPKPADKPRRLDPVPQF